MIEEIIINAFAIAVTLLLGIGWWHKCNEREAFEERMYRDGYSKRWGEWIKERPAEEVK